MTAMLTHHYRPRGGCHALFKSKVSEVLMSGPAGTGKSRACLEKMHQLAIRNAGFRGLMVRKTAVSFTSTGLVTFREHVAKEHLTAAGMVWYGGSQQEPAQYRYSNGSSIVVGGLDRATKIMSSEYDAIYVQEAIELTETDWEALTTRLRHGRISFQQLMADTNPDVPTHWLRERANRGTTQLIESRHSDNPALYTDDGELTPAGVDYLSKLDNLTGVRKQRLRDGLWIAAEGMIYEDYDPAVHLIDRFDVPKDWPRWWAVDFGYTNPTVIQRWAADPDGRLFLYGEQYHTRKLVEDHAKELKAILERTKEPWPRAIICDHDAEDRATLERHIGRGTTAANKNVSEGLQAVASRLRAAGDGRPRLFVMRDAVARRDQALIDSRKPTCTAEEIPGYIWEGNTKERPLKEDDHGADAMRYIVCEIDLGKTVRMRWL